MNSGSNVLRLPEIREIRGIMLTIRERIGEYGRKQAVQKCAGVCG